MGLSGLRLQSTRVGLLRLTMLQLLNEDDDSRL